MLPRQPEMRDTELDTTELQATLGHLVHEHWAATASAAGAGAAAAAAGAAA
eukprot:SAG31_NODE_11949_length_982_cov_6.568516_1_plen_50_part_01